ncbi:MAG: hypothetical protein Q9163_003845 [Psora crenata]
MFGKFRPPLLKIIEKPISPNSPDSGSSEPLPKKRRISNEPNPRQPGPQLVFKRPGISSLPRKPLLAVDNPAVATQSLHNTDGVIEGYYNVLWRKQSTKKYKTWEGDGVLHVIGGYAYLRDISGRDMGKTACNTPLLPGSKLSIGGTEIEVDSLLAKEDYWASQSSLMTSGAKPAPPLIDNPLPKIMPSADSVAAILAEKQKAMEAKKIAGSRRLAKQIAFKNPLLADTLMPKKEAKEPTPRHDPNAYGALIMERPRNAPEGRQLVDVVVDPLLSRSLRDHQREGVKFLYECVMGMRDFDGRGAILADEMGLGKTLQTIALIWTLLKQNPIDGDPPVIQKALIVCPVTLINNWRKEFRKWLGADRLGVYSYDDSQKRITDFTKGRAYNVMIIGYEKLRTVSEELKKGRGIDIVVADEGHRLKSAKNKSALAIKQLDTPRRVILSGTPIQNELSEFFMMVDFVNPGLLGPVKTFTKEFELPIVKSRQPGALRKDVEKGEARNQDLASLTSKFILRRTTDVILKYLPSKTEYVLLCRPTTAQALTYQHVLACPAFQSAIGSPEASLQLITILKKVCNSPFLLRPDPPTDDATPQNPLTTAVLTNIPPRFLRTNQASTKLRVLDQLLYTLHTTTSEKVVLVSSYTSTLNLFETLLTSLALPYLRLDGTTPSSKRQELVDTFNCTPASQVFAFLLSAKAGGVGLNLVGASRLVLFDIDWNPATDLQAMARIHRDGQKRPCIIYRFLMAGGLDEKIWQRQVTKLGLASNIMDQKMGTASFSREELGDLFRLDEGLSCQTHDLLGCNCGGRGLQDVRVEGQPPIEILHLEGEVRPDSEDMPGTAQFTQAYNVCMEEQERKIQTSRRALGRSSKNDGTQRLEYLMTYSHIDTWKFAAESDTDSEALISDEVLLKVLKDEGNRISFAFAKTTC